MTNLCRTRISGLRRLTTCISNYGGVQSQICGKGRFDHETSPWQSTFDQIQSAQHALSRPSDSDYPLLSGRHFVRRQWASLAKAQRNDPLASVGPVGLMGSCLCSHRRKPSYIVCNSAHTRVCNETSSVMPLSCSREELSTQSTSAKKSVWGLLAARNYAKKAKTKKTKGKGGKHGRDDSDDEDDDEDVDNHEQHRRQRKGNKGDHGEGVEGGRQGVGNPIESSRDQMKQAVDALTEELAQLRTERANPSLLSHIMVRYGGDGPFPLNTIAAVTVRDPQTLSILVYDPNMIDAVEKAVLDSPSGLVPKRTEDGCLVPLPRMTNEVREVVAKEAVKAAENAKVRIRRIRKDVLASVKKNSAGISEDDTKRQEKEIEEITQDFVNNISTLSKAKEKDILHG